MNKIIEQSQQLQTVKICYGNDFSLSVTVCVWNADTSAWDKVDLSAAQDVEMFLVAQNGKRIKTNTTIDAESNVVADIPATYLSKTLYAIEITFKLDNRNRRTYSPGLIQIVNDTDDAGFSTLDYVTNDAYHFDIKVENDVAWLNIGHLPSEYITEDELSEELSYYVTSSELSDAAYVTTTNLNETLESYASKSYVSSYYYDKTDIDSTLNSYVQSSHLYDDIYNKTEVDNKDEAVKSYVSSYYYDKTDIDSTLNSYVQSSHLYDDIYNKTEVDNKDDAVKSYVSSYYYDKTEADSILGSYINNADYDSSNYHINLKNGDTVITYIDATDFVIDGMIDNVYIENGYLVIDFNTASGKQDIYIPLSAIFDPENYYTKTDIDTKLQDYVTYAYVEALDLVTRPELAQMSYITTSDVDTILNDASYVTTSELSNASYATETYVGSYIDPLDSRVTYLEEHGGGGGGTVPDNVVTSYDGTYIYCLSQSDYDTLEQNQQLDTDTFYYITDASTDYVSYAYLETFYVDKSYLESYYVDGSYIENNYATISYVETSYNDLDTRVTYLEEHGGGGGGTIPDNVVTSYDGTYIYCLSQSDYDTLEQNQQLDTDTFYYITDATSNYVSSSSVHNIVTMSYSDYQQITPDAYTMYIIL